MWCFAVAALAADPIAERAGAADRMFRHLSAAYASGATTAEAVYLWSTRLRDAQLAMGDPNAGAAHLQRVEALAKAVEAMVASGAAPASDADAARWFVLEATLQAAPGATAAPAPATPAPAPAGGTEACFASCDKAWEGCTTEAEHLRLGVGAVPPNAACARTADERCGVGRSQTATECRDRELRTCVAAERLASCSKQQALCTARCR